MSKSQMRAFRVHAGGVDGGHAHLVREASFEAAAVAYLEDYPHGTAQDDEVRVTVQEVETGREHCFRVDLHRGTTGPCD